MLPQRHRMGKDEFDRLAVRGRKISGATLNLSYIRPENTRSSGFSFVVPKKVSKTAPARNRLRRRGYRALAELWDAIPHPIIAAFYAKKGAEDLTFSELREEVRVLISKMA